MGTGVKRDGLYAPPWMVKLLHIAPGRGPVAAQCPRIRATISSATAFGTAA